MLTLFFPGAGGGLLRPESNSSDPDARQNIVGSFIVIQAKSIEAVWELLHKEIFYTSGEVVCSVTYCYPYTGMTDATGAGVVGSRKTLRSAGVRALQGGEVRVGQMVHL